MLRFPFLFSVLFLWMMAWAEPGLAAADAFRLFVAPELAQTGLVRYLAPRFRFRSGIRVLRAETLEAADAALLPVESVDEGLRVRAALLRPALAERQGDRRYVYLVLTQDPARAEAARAFLDWMFSRPGKASIGSFPDEKNPAFTPADRAPVTVAPARFDGDPERGHELARKHCRRCHVVEPDDPFAGIGSTPSFMALRALPDWQRRFSVFWSLRPHLGLVDVAEMSPERLPSNPVPIAPVRLTLDDVEDVLAYVARLAPKDLGRPVEMR